MLYIVNTTGFSHSCISQLFMLDTTQGAGGIQLNRTNNKCSQRLCFNLKKTEKQATKNSQMAVHICFYTKKS